MQATSSLQCPPRCQLACCARFAAQLEFDTSYAFEQCTADACALQCTAPPDQAPIGEAAVPQLGKPAAVGEYERIKPKGRRFNLHQYFMTNPSLSGRGGILAERNDVPKLDLVRQ